MLDHYISKRERNVCSIEDLNHDLYKEELLLSNQNRNETILEEDEQELFQLYISPYSEKGAKNNKHRELDLSEDATILKGSHREESLLQTKNQEYEGEIQRLKNIILKKNTVIGELTEQLRIYYQQSKKKSNQSNKKSARNEKNCENCEDNENQNQKVNECLSNKCKSERIFFQKNNLQLYNQLVSSRAKSDKLENQIASISEELGQFRLKMEKAQTENKLLRKNNLQLLKSTKKYLNQGSEQIKIMSKMREVLAEKLSLKEMNIHLPDYKPKEIAAKNKTERVKQVKKQSNIPAKPSRSLQKCTSKENSSKERCFSQDCKKNK